MKCHKTFAHINHFFAYGVSKISAHDEFHRLSLEGLLQLLRGEEARIIKKHVVLIIRRPTTFSKLVKISARHLRIFHH